MNQIQGFVWRLKRKNLDRVCRDGSSGLFFQLCSAGAVLKVAKRNRRLLFITAPCGSCISSQFPFRTTTGEPVKSSFRVPLDSWAVLTLPSAPMMPAVAPFRSSGRVTETSSEKTEKNADGAKISRRRDNAQALRKVRS